MKKMPVGISDFKEIIDNNYYYIDKTMFIKEILDDGAKVLLLTRPRRFGKTINMNMLKYFFENTEKDNSYLFKNLEIYKEKYICNKNMGKYPVIFITLKDIKNSNWDRTYNKIKSCIEQEYDRFSFLLTSDKLTYVEKNIFKKIREGKANEIEYENSLKYLSRYLYKYYGVAPILLLDEYDVPIQNSYINGFYDRTIEFIRNWLSGAVKDNSYISFAIMTGILRIGKESIFSGMNNLKVCTILDNQYYEYFGFTEEEVNRILNQYGRAEEFEIIKKWYNGYIFGGNQIYNPWSIINYINDKNRKPKAYWLHTSSNDIIHEIIKYSNIKIQEELRKLIEGSEIEEIIDTNIIYKDIYSEENNIFSFLLFAGYLKINEVSQNDFGFLIGKLSIPNKEIKIIYRQEIMTQITKGINPINQIKMVSALINGDIYTFEKIFSDIILKTSSFYDSSESFYHGFMLGITTLLTDNYIIKSNRESGYGRFDLALIPRNKNNIAVIMEFKKANNKEELIIESKNALKQIDEKKYDVDIYDLGVKKIYKYGISFMKKEFNMVKEEIIKSI